MERPNSCVLACRKDLFVGNSVPCGCLDSREGVTSTVSEAVRH